MQQMIVFKMTACGEIIDKRECRANAGHHGDGNRSVQRDNGRRLDAFKRVVKANDLEPIRICCAGRLTMHSGDRRLKRKWAGPGAKRLLDKRQRLHDLLVVPSTPVLILE